MKKIVLLVTTCCLALCVVIISCNKTVEVPVSYTVTDTNSNPLQNIYIPDSGTYAFPVWVKFLSGTAGDSVSLSFTGLPADVRVTPDSFSAAPSYIEDFVFYTNHAVHGTYPISLVSYSRTTGYTKTNFNLTVVSANCLAPFIGTLTCDNSCNHSYIATGTTSPYANTMFVNNFGGYGSNVNVELIFDCDDDSVFIHQNNYGNNLVLSGQGTFTGNSMIIYYYASSTPLGGSATCIDTLRVQ